MFFLFLESVGVSVDAFALRRLALVPCLISLANGPCFQIPRTKKGMQNSGIAAASHDGFLSPAGGEESGERCLNCPVAS